MSEPQISARADRIWQKIRGQYLTKLADVPNPPPDFCKLFDSASPAVLNRVLGQLPYKHPQWPPTFGELAIMVAAADPSQSPSQTTDWQAVLSEQTQRIVSRHWDSWSQFQRLTFTYLGTGDAATGTGFRFTALRVRADPTTNKPERTYQFVEGAQ